MRSICVLVLLPRYLVETWPELREAIVQNKPAIDRLVQVQVEKELLSQKSDLSFQLFSLSKCILRHDYILEYMFDLKSAA